MRIRSLVTLACCVCALGCDPVRGKYRGEASLTLDEEGPAMSTRQEYVLEAASRSDRLDVWWLEKTGSCTLRAKFDRATLRGTIDGGTCTFRGASVNFEEGWAAFGAEQISVDATGTLSVQAGPVMPGGGAVGPKVSRRFRMTFSGKR